MSNDNDVRLIAFYLPQYHPIPENDNWWGTGFTEWRNVVRAKPIFDRHYQPHIPADLGFYDLRLPEARQAQADLAGSHGIDGFCYYHYWFNGKQLLERPFNEVFTSGSPRFPFCLCWANENWTRRWDGGDNEILIAQHYSAEDDLAHIRSLLPYFADERYIKIDGKPLFLIYRIDLLPDPRATIARWRNEVVRNGLPGAYFCNVLSSGVQDPNPALYGLDAAVDFQPNWRQLPPLVRISKKRRWWSLTPASDVSDLHGIYRYPDMVRLATQQPEPGYPTFPCVTPGFDNSPRRRMGAQIFIDSSPEIYQSWLLWAIQKSTTRFEKGSRIVFVNAWNEWAEGNHLEPDLESGLSYLEATGAAVKKARLKSCVVC